MLEFATLQLTCPTLAAVVHPEAMVPTPIVGMCVGTLVVGKVVGSDELGASLGVAAGIIDGLTVGSGLVGIAEAVGSLAGSPCACLRCSRWSR